MLRSRAVAVSFAATVVALLSGSSLRAQVVINEIHYNPDVKTDPAEFIELHNPGTAPVNVAGWYFSDGINYALPATNIAAGGYLVVAQNPSFLFTKFGVRAVGPFNPDGSSGLSSTGERITLRNAAGQVVDEVDYQLGFPWPTVGDPVAETSPGTGSSIELIHPGLDNNLGGSWRSAQTSGSGGTSQTLLADRSAWRYFKGTAAPSNLSTAWRQPGFDDTAWLSGSTPIGYGESFITTALSDMNGGYTTVFLRRTFTVSDPAQFSQLILQAQYDDGFKVWINGVNVIDNQANMPAGEVPHTGSAVGALENLNFVSFNLAVPPASVLVAGENVIAVQAANASLSGSSDFFFDCRLLGQIGGSSSGGPSPGRVNTVFATNAPPQIRQVDHAPGQPRSGQPVAITAKVTDPHGVASVLLEYQVVRPGSYIELTDAAYTNAANWTPLPMNDAGVAGDALAGDDVYTATIPATAQAHRNLVRYRITVADTLGRSVRVPYADDPVPNFAYFVYDGVPGWRGAVNPAGTGSNATVVNFSSEVMGRLPVFHLIGRSNAVATATWFSRYGGDAYQWQGALVYDGKV
ncbi:MAG TPA: lamin tail domain-containing protein, partial [Methylomirabilota bacterium]|nr:lamin tail domain-containing protein [Methylomirabilota bacterium]